MTIALTIQLDNKQLWALVNSSVEVNNVETQKIFAKNIKINQKIQKW